MTRYLHERCPTVTLKSSSTVQRQTRLGIEIKDVPPIFAAFNKFGRGNEMPVPGGIPRRHSLARGWIETGNCIERIKMEGAGWWDEETGEDITKEIVEAFFADHKERDRKMIQVDKEGRWVPREELVDGGGGFHCSVCNQFLITSQALEQHNMSVPHLQKELTAQKGRKKVRRTVSGQATMKDSHPIEEVSQV